MTTFTLDTHLAANRLIAAGFEQKQATEIVDLLVKSQDGLVTKEYFKEYLDYKLEKEFKPMQLELMAIKTTLAILMGGLSPCWLRLTDDLTRFQISRQRLLSNHNEPLLKFQ